MPPPPPTFTQLSPRFITRLPHLTSPLRLTEPVTSRPSPMTSRITAETMFFTSGHSSESPHVGVPVIRLGYEGLFDRPGRRPADQIVPGAGLVVRTRPARSAERLLSHDRAGRFVVDVEIPGREA